MGWDEDVATREYAWVRLMSRLKYDGYRDYLAGVRFAESLAGWLQQFDQADRQVAYDFVKKRLIYYSPTEIQRLVEQFYPRIVQPRLRALVSRITTVPSYLVWSDSASNLLYAQKQRQTLFIGLSDGARIDILRRANAGTLVNDQIVLATHIDDDKWEDLGKKLGEDKLFAGAAETPKFGAVYLIDDFSGSGTTFIRRKPDGSWTGKAKKFYDGVRAARDRIIAKGKAFPLIDDFSLHIHHYISTTQAYTAIAQRNGEISKQVESGNWFASIEVTAGIQLPAETPLTRTTDPGMWSICERYYDHDLFVQLKEHLDQAGQTDLKFGYANCALPVVLEHNCPNNAITILWAETDGKDGPSMRPLFRRRHRHS